MGTATKKVTVAGLLAEHETTAGPKRRTLRDNWSRLAMDAVMNDDDATAKVYAEAIRTASESTASRSTAVEVDWRQVTADRIAELRSAADAIESGSIRPSGTPDDVDLTNLPSPSDDVNGDRLAGVRLAGMRNVPEFIAERIAELGEGWHTASELAKGQVDAPSTGAIGAVYAKMTPTEGDPFVVPGVIAGRNEKGSQAFSAA